MNKSKQISFQPTDEVRDYLNTVPNKTHAINAGIRLLISQPAITERLNRVESVIEGLTTPAKRGRPSLSQIPEIVKITWSSIPGQPPRDQRGMIAATEADTLKLIELFTPEYGRNDAIMLAEHVIKNSGKFPAIEKLVEYVNR